MLVIRVFVWLSRLLRIFRRCSGLPLQRKIGGGSFASRDARGRGPVAIFEGAAEPAELMVVVAAVVAVSCGSQFSERATNCSWYSVCLVSCTVLMVQPLRDRP